MLASWKTALHIIVVVIELKITEVLFLAKGAMFAEDSPLTVTAVNLLDELVRRTRQQGGLCLLSSHLLFG
jgi:hypothetical protein